MVPVTVRQRRFGWPMSPCASRTAWLHGGFAIGLNGRLGPGGASRRPRIKLQSVPSGAALS